jgi:AraC family transcriptional regulator, regulatory protein of adaptative response / DNA-3-methyladenine glycosylase II
MTAIESVYEEAVSDTTFTAVTTTGIYCRPGCGGRPRADHTVPFPLAAAAEAAGFRACLRCRPYRSSDLAGWLTAPELVCRAVQLIVDGAMDEASEDELAARVGVSGRHLRRLFLDHVGATPDQVARSRRAHFARRLLDDTELPIGDVAFAAGFGSVRQMNRVMRDIFRAAPKELRARRRRADRLVADGGLVLRLPFQPPLAWHTMLAFLAPRAIPGVEAVEDETYRRTIVVDGGPGVVEAWPGGDDHLLLRVHLPVWDGLIHIVQRTRRLFDLDADPAEITAALGRDRRIRSLLRETPGVRVPGAWDPFESGVRAILGQQVSVTAATTIAGRVVEKYGRAVPGLEAMGLTHCFPDPNMLATADLGDVGLTGARAAAVRAFAAAVAAGRLNLDRSMPLDRLVGGLTALPGVGDWTAQYLALRLGERDAFPCSDLGLRRALARNGSMPAAREVESKAEPWRPWRGYAAMLLWTAAATRPDPTSHDGHAMVQSTS